MGPQAPLTVAVELHEALAPPLLPTQVQVEVVPSVPLSSTVPVAQVSAAVPQAPAIGAGEVDRLALEPVQPNAVVGLLLVPDAPLVVLGSQLYTPPKL